MERSAGPRAVVAYVALREDLIWALRTTSCAGSRRSRPRTSTAAGETGRWPSSEAHRFLGDSARSRAYADSAASAYEALIAGWGNRADRGQVVAVRALALAHAGRLADARGRGEARRLDPAARLGHPETLRRVRAEPGRRDGGGPALGRGAAARHRARPAQLSRGWIAIDRTLAPLRDDPEYQALVRDQH